nr:MAG TPA: hypothetical protein [Caudoviricetes sp.]
MCIMRIKCLTMRIMRVIIMAEQEIIKRKEQSC